MALPTGFEKRLDVVRDLEEIWAPQATNRGWVIVCPASSSGFPFGVSKVAGFGLGAERLVPYLIDDLRKKGLLNQDGGAFLVDLWGGGRGAISVARQAPGTFRHGRRVPERLDLGSML